MSAIIASSDFLTLAFLGWQGIDIPLLIAMPILLVASGFFSGSETALFGMTQSERMALRTRGGVIAASVQSLLAEPRMLLITVLLGNMTVNVLYFVISSVLIMRADAGPVIEIALAVISLLGVVLLGEVLPKMLASTRRMTFARLAAPILFTIHTAIAPVRLLLDGLIVVPLSRLTAPAEAPPRLTAAELSDLLDASSRQGVIDREEQQILQDVLRFSEMKVRDVMTPRVRIDAVPADATLDQVRDVVQQARVTRLPVYDGDLDHITGMLHAKRYLIGAIEGRDALSAATTPPVFVPVMATLDQLLEDLRRSHTKSAIVVDEYGGTAGFVALEDVVERLVGDIAGPDEPPMAAAQLIGLSTWLVDGRTNVRDWAEAFNLPLGPTRASTLGGLIFERLGRAPETGDTVRIGNVELEVRAVVGSQVGEALVRMLDEGGENVTSASGAGS